MKKINKPKRVDLTKKQQFALNSLFFFQEIAEEQAMREGETGRQRKERVKHMDRLFKFISEAK